MVNNNICKFVMNLALIGIRTTIISSLWCLIYCSLDRSPLSNVVGVDLLCLSKK